MLQSVIDSCYDLARHVLKEDFISPMEIEACRGLVYPDADLRRLRTRLPDHQGLEWCRDNGMVLMAGPPTPMTMLDVRSVHADFFYAKGPEQDDDGWYDEANEEFARTDKVEALYWIAFRKELVEDSLNKTWPDQAALIADPMMLPNAAEVTWVLTTFKAVRDIYLLDEFYVRTSSTSSLSGRVCIGDFGTDGLNVYNYWGDDCCPRLGVAASRKF
jgi:hypothetical protein